MTIMFGEKIKVEGERAQWTVYQMRVVGESSHAAARKPLAESLGREDWVAVAFYSRLENALGEVLKIKIGLSRKTHKDIKSAMVEIRELWEEVQGYTKGVPA